MPANRDSHRTFNYSNVMSTLAVFLAVAGGTALAAKLPRSSVQAGTVSDTAPRSKAVVDGESVKAADLDSSQTPSGPAGGSLAGSYPNPSLAANSVGRRQLRDNAVTGAEVANASLGGGDITDGSLNSVDVNDNALTSDDVFADTLTGKDINESTLGQVPQALLGGFGRTGAEGSCDPESTTFLTCATTPTLDVPAGARALVLARVLVANEANASSAIGDCRLGASSTGAIPNTTMTLTAFDDHPQSSTLIGITPALPTGTTTFGIDCNQGGFGAIEYVEAAVSALLISSD